MDVFMQIRAKKRSGRSENLFVFEFTDYEKDARPYIDGIKSYVERHCYDDDLKRMILRPLAMLDSRIDGMYSHDDVVLSGSLFADEMAQFTEGLSILMAISN